MFLQKKLPFFLIFIFFAYVTTAFTQGSDDKKTKVKEELFEVLTKGDGITAKKILQKNPDLVKCSGGGGWTPLHMSFRSLEITEYLINKGADIHAGTDAGWTPLHSHAYYGTPRGVKILLKHGAKVNQKNAFGQTPLMSAVRWNKYEIIKVLAAHGGDINTTESLGRTPLIKAAISGFAEMASILTEKGADVSIKDTPYKRTALHFAVLYGHLDIVKHLIAKGASIDETDTYGRTPLYYAARYGHGKVAEFLKSSGAKGKIDRTHFGYSPVLNKKLAKGEAAIWFLGRIGYAVKTRHYFLIFSYYTEGNFPAEMHLANGYINIDEIKDKNIVVFAGSRSYWHHNPKRYRQWQNQLEKIRFIYSFEDIKGTRNSHYLEDVDGPDYIYLPGGKKKKLDGLTVESFNNPNRGTGFLVEVDGLVICHAGDLLLFREAQKQKYEEAVQYLANTGKKIDILFHTGVFLYGRILPASIKGLDYTLTTLKPKALYTMGGGSCEYLLGDVKNTLKKHNTYTKVYSPEHQGDMFWFKKK